MLEDFRSFYSMVRSGKSQSCAQSAYSVWNYLSTPNDGNRFSLVDDETRTILSPELARIISGIKS